MPNDPRRNNPTLIRLALFGPPTFEAPLSTIRTFPCPWCTEINRANGHVRAIPRMTRCIVCNDRKSVVIPGEWPGVLALLGQPKEQKR